MAIFQMNDGDESNQKCPICGAAVESSERYPSYVCGNCHLRATDADGRSLKFSNASFSGGFVATYADTLEVRASHECFIDGIKCWADEAQMGGIVIKPYDEKD